MDNVHCYEISIFKQFIFAAIRLTAWSGLTEATRWSIFRSNRYIRSDRYFQKIGFQKTYYLQQSIWLLGAVWRKLSSIGCISGT